MNLEKAVIQIKKMIEDAILEGGTKAKNNLIKSSKPINLIHEAVKNSLISNGINKNNLRPLIGESKGELPLYGFLKKKAQDISVIPTSLKPVEEKVVLGNIDHYGAEFTQRTITINVRSQLSSAAKNFDTLYERTFAEALNFHEKYPSMVLGEVYMIAIREYDTQFSDNKKVAFKQLNSKIQEHVEKYIQYFELLNNRNEVGSDKHKYEKVALVLVDFSTETPKIYSTKEELIKDGLLSPSSNVNVQNLAFDSLVPTLLAEYKKRFGKPCFIV